VDDVPSPIDLRNPADARVWEESAQRRPGRTETFKAFRTELALANPPFETILELGSGPGFLAEHLLSEMPGLRLMLLDFSEAMHNLARARLGNFSDRVSFVLRDFKSAEWNSGLGIFDAIITNQAVHELRHKRYATTLHAQVKSLLRRGGIYLVADHFYGEGGMLNGQLYMSPEEQASALRSAGYGSVTQLCKHGSLVMHRAA
jgi:SAM-dependent methyltransferase